MALEAYAYTDNIDTYSIVEIEGYGRYCKKKKKSIGTALLQSQPCIRSLKFVFAT